MTTSMMILLFASGAVLLVCATLLVCAVVVGRAVMQAGALTAATKIASRGR